MSVGVGAESRMRRQLRSWGGFAVALILLSIVAFVGYRGVQQFRDDVGWVDHTHLVLEHIERSESALLAADGARRAYRIGSDRSDLAQLDDRIDEANRELNEVARLAVDNPRQQARIAALRPLITDRIAIMRTGIDLPKMELLTQQVRDEQRAIQARGVALAKQYHLGIDAMRNEELGLLRTREGQSQSSASLTRWTIVIGSVLGVGLVAVLLLSLMAENRKRMRVQHELEEKTSILSAVFEGTEDAIYVKDRAGRYVLANTATAKNLSRSRNDVIGKSNDEMMAPQDTAAANVADRKVVDSGESTTYEQTFSRDGVMRTVLSFKAPYRNGDNEVIGIIGVSRDITERKNLEQRVITQNAERGLIIERLERQSREIIALSEMANFLQTTKDAQEAYDLVGHFALKLFGRGGGIGVTAPSRNIIETVARWGDTAMMPTFHPSDCWALRTGRVHDSGAANAVACTHVLAESLPSICIPLIAQGEALGILQLSGAPMADEAQQLLRAFTEQLALALANIQLRETLRAQAVRDPLTSLYNRRYLDETLIREVSRAKRKGSPVSVIMIDLDHFKRLNDTFGHAAGDEVLKRFAGILLGGIRREDVACRYGGEEFALILPELEIAQAIERAERLRSQLENLHVELDGHRIGPLSASFGVAVYPSNGDNGELLMRAADSALYQAKGRGRNRVVTAELAAQSAG